MLAFRSEEHLDRWLRVGHPTGESMSAEQQWELARLWFTGRDQPGWKKRGAEEAEATFRSVGLVSDFWRLS